LEIHLFRFIGNVEVFNIVCSSEVSRKESVGGFQCDFIVFRVGNFDIEVDVAIFADISLSFGGEGSGGLNAGLVVEFGVVLHVDGHNDGEFFLFFARRNTFTIKLGNGDSAVHIFLVHNNTDVHGVSEIEFVFSSFDGLAHNVVVEVGGSGDNFSEGAVASFFSLDVFGHEFKSVHFQIEDLDYGE